MTRVTTIMLSMSYADMYPDDRWDGDGFREKVESGLARVNKLPTVAEQHNNVCEEHGFVEIDHAFGGPKAAEGWVFGAAFNRFRTKLFLAELASIEWKSPELVQVFIKEEQEDLFVVSTVKQWRDEWQRAVQQAATSEVQAEYDKWASGKAQEEIRQSPEVEERSEQEEPTICGLPVRLLDKPPVYQSMPYRLADAPEVLTERDDKYPTCNMKIDQLQLKKLHTDFDNGKDFGKAKLVLQERLAEALKTQKVAMDALLEWLEKQ